MSRTAVITGASRGLGFCLVKRHLSAGDYVYALVRSRSEQLDSLAQKAVNLKILSCDVSSTYAVQQATETVRESGRTVDLLYNNAGVNLDIKDEFTFEQTNFDILDRTFTINSAGPMRVLKAFAPLLKNGSTVISISSGVASLTLCTDAKEEYAYRMSKAALNMAMRLFDNTVRERGIRTLIVDPGWMHTDLCGPEAPCDPEENAGHIMHLADHIDELPPDSMFVNFLGEQLPW